MIHLLFKSIDPDKIIGVSNLKDEIDKSNLANFGNNIEEFIDGKSSN